MDSLPGIGPSAPIPTRPQARPLLEQLREAAQNRGAARDTADRLVSWTRAFILFLNKQHPATLGLPHVSHFLEHVVKTTPQPLPALAQARAALTLLYGGVLGSNLGELPQPRPPRLLDQLRLVLRVRHYSPRTEGCYVQWAKRFILFHYKRHPRELGPAEVSRRAAATVVAFTA